LSTEFEQAQKIISKNDNRDLLVGESLDARRSFQKQGGGGGQREGADGRDKEGEGQTEGHVEGAEGRKRASNIAKPNDIN
jgi:hypothetical protein